MSRDTVMLSRSWTPHQRTSHVASAVAFCHMAQWFITISRSRERGHVVDSTDSPLAVAMAVAGVLVTWHPMD